MKPVIQLRGLGKSFKERRVLGDISLEVYPGEILGILGPNGAGKSTTIRCLMGIILPDEGRVQFSLKGRETTDVPREAIGFCRKNAGYTAV